MLSILIPSFNNSKYLPIAVASALSLKNLGEIIIIDDNSIDDTKVVVKELQRHSDKIRYFKNKKNIGVGFSFIKAIKVSKFSYVLMCNSDDFFIPNNIDKLFEFLIKHKLDLAYGKMAIQKEGKVYKYKHPGYKNKDYINDRDEFKDLLIFDMYMPSFGTIINSSILKKFYNEKYMLNLNKNFGSRFKAHDYDLFLNLSKKGKKIGFLDEFVCVWKPEEGSQSGTDYFHSGSAARESAFLFERYCDDTCGLDPNDIKIIKRRINRKLKLATKLNQFQKEKIYEEFPFIFN